MTAPWLQTRNGTKWEILSPSAADVNWREVAHALSNLCRFTGHTRAFYSVAEHSFRVWEMASLMSDNPRVQLLALLHDAHEFVLGDKATPLQHALAQIVPDFKAAWTDLKRRTDAAIFMAAGLTPRDVERHSNLVHHADMAVLMRERQQIVGVPPEPWDAKLEAIPPAPVTVRCYAPTTARGLFLNALEPLLASVAADNDRRKIDVRRAWLVTAE